jgi:hypothetical protein
MYWRLLLILLTLSADAIAAPATADPEMILDTLEPAGIKLYRPRDWQVKSQHDPSRLTWAIWKEAPSKDGDRTGMRVQMFSDISHLVHKSAAAFVSEQLDKRSNLATKVIRRCEPVPKEKFTLSCLEVEEGGLRVFYSMLHSDALDLVLLTSAGTDIELWPTYAATFERMRELELPDFAAAADAAQ